MAADKGVVELGSPIFFADWTTEVEWRPTEDPEADVIATVWIMTYEDRATAIVTPGRHDGLPTPADQRAALRALDVPEYVKPAEVS